MTQTVKTLIFGAVAAASIMVAAGTYYANKPADLEAFSDVGEEFYPDFENPNEATGLRVAAYNDETGKTDIFSVDVKDGVWRIPSHHNYPADGKDRLAKTAASMIGVTRAALIERSKDAQKRYGTLDPLDKNVSGTEGRGDRITLYKGDQVLVDFIVGKKVENEPDLYYVRRADEDRIYTADLGNFQVSTKFGDWIEKDILTVEQSDLRELVISRYFVDEAQGKVVAEGQIELTRDSAQDAWKLKDLNSDEEKLKTSEINSMVRALEDLQIVGVRPKPPELAEGLKSKDGTIRIDPFIRRDLQQKGVFITNQGEFVYNEGKVNVGTKDGVLYELGFGEEFTGTEVDIEVGGQKSPEEEAKELESDTADEKADDKESQEEAEEKIEEKSESEEETDDTEKRKSRYLFVTVYFDKSLLGPPPEKPKKPQPPAEGNTKKEGDNKPADQAKDDSDKAASEDGKDADAKEEASETDKADKSSEEQTKPEDDQQDQPKEQSSEAKKDDPQKAYEEALKEYELLLEVYETKKKEYEEKLKKGEDRVAELNARFADWYYVISEDVFDRLKLKREDLVEPVEEKESESTEPESQPDSSSMTKEETRPEASSKAEETEKPAVAPDAPPAANQPATEEKSPPADKPESESKADGASSTESESSTEADAASATETSGE